MRSSSASRELDVHLNRNVRGLEPSATVAINERSNELRRQGWEIYKLGLGQSPFPVPQPVVRALQAHAHEKDYLPARGLPALREAVAAYHRRAQGIDAAAERVLVGPGSKELMFLLQLAYDGELLIPAPSWVSYAPQAHILGRTVQWIPTERRDRWKVNPARLEAACAADPGRPRLLVLNTPSNPTGAAYDAAELEAIAAVAARHRVLLLSDEIYGELHHAGGHVSVARFYPEGTIVSAGLSKWCGAGGWRLGTFLFPPGLDWLAEAMAAIATETYTSTSAPIQHAAVRAFEGGTEIEAYLVRSRRVLAALGTWAARRLRAAGVAVDDPDGGFYLFPDFGPLAERLRERGILGARPLCERLLLETGVAALPGVDFGRPRAELTLRIAYVDFDGAAALAAVDEGPIDEAWLRARCGRVVEAIERICAWVA